LEFPFLPDSLRATYGVIHELLPIPHCPLYLAFCSRTVYVCVLKAFFSSWLFWRKGAPWVGAPPFLVWSPWSCLWDALFCSQQFRLHSLIFLFSCGATSSCQVIEISIGPFRFLEVVLLCLAPLTVPFFPHFSGFHLRSLPCYDMALLRFYPPPRSLRFPFLYSVACREFIGLPGIVSHTHVRVLW